MKPNAETIKEEIKKAGRQLYDEISYTVEGQPMFLNDELYKVNVRYKGNLLKSVMKELEFESTIALEKGTEVIYDLGILHHAEPVDYYNLVNYGTFIVYNVEKLEDADRYKILCYDKILNSMKPYENMNISYPITLREYAKNVANHLGLTFANEFDNFPNYNQSIPTELYLDAEGNDIGFTFRDVLDQIAEATASTIVVNDRDELELRYINNTNDNIDEEFLKNVNVNFGEKYGPVNSIVLSRSGESDNVYEKDQQSIDENGLTEIKIVDNQIMNGNNRADYLPALAGVLFGLEYYINDFLSAGILIYDICDKYNIQVGENIYNCLMLNDDVMRKNGLEETIYTDMLEQAETDYTKADKDDRRINMTYLLVDKQNQQIESVITNVTEQNNKISQITQTVDDLSSKISDIADITIAGETSYATLDLDNINASEPIMIKVHPNLVNISYYYPNSNMFPNLDLFMRDRKIRFYNKTTEESVDYTIPDDLLWLNQNVYDEFYLDYESQTCQVIKRCGYNADGTVYALANEVITDYPYPEILLDDGNYTISLYGYAYGYLMARLVASNIYTTQFATKVEMNSAINQSATEISTEVNEKLTNYSTTTEMNSAIVQKASEITSTVSSTYETKANASSKYSQLQQTDSQIQTTVGTKVGKNEVISSINQTSEAITINANKLGLNANNVLNILSGNTINLTSKNIAISSNNFSVDKNGNMTCNNANISGTILSSNATITGGKIQVVGGNESTDLVRVTNSQDSNIFSYIQPRWTRISWNRRSKHRFTSRKKPFWWFIYIIT